MHAAVCNQLGILPCECHQPHAILPTILAPPWIHIYVWLLLFFLSSFFCPGHTIIKSMRDSLALIDLTMPIVPSQVVWPHGNNKLPTHFNSNLSIRPGPIVTQIAIRCCYSKACYWVPMFVQITNQCEWMDTCTVTQRHMSMCLSSNMFRQYLKGLQFLKWVCLSTCKFLTAGHICAITAGNGSCGIQWEAGPTSSRVKRERGAATNRDPFQEGK